MLLTKIVVFVIIDIISIMGGVGIQTVGLIAYT